MCRLCCSRRQCPGECFDSYSSRPPSGWSMHPPGRWCQLEYCVGIQVLAWLGGFGGSLVARYTLAAVAPSRKAGRGVLPGQAGVNHCYSFASRFVAMLSAAPESGTRCGARTEHATSRNVLNPSSPKLTVEYCKCAEYVGATDPFKELVARSSRAGPTILFNLVRHHGSMSPISDGAAGNWRRGCWS